MEMGPYTIKYRICACGSISFGEKLVGVGGLN